MENIKRIVFHVDVNSAYLSWEAAYRLQHGDSVDLREIPSIVGGDPVTRHGIVLAKSIPAKMYKIQTGEAVGAALKKCPHLTIIKPRYQLYKACSQAMREILQEYSPFIQQYSIDEYFMDYSDMAADFPDPIQAAYTIKHRIATELGFTVNIGISNNKLLAKMASELEKPDKVHTLFPEEIPEKMWILPVEDMFMVGRATAPKLRSRGIYSIGDLAKCDPNLLRSWLKSQGVMLWNYAHGIESSPIKNAAIPIKGIGNSTTIPFDVDDARTAHMVMLSLVEMVSARLRQTSLLGEVVSVSLKTHELFSYSHQKKLDSPTDCTNAIYREAINLFDEAWEREPLRHLGVRISELCSNDLYQMTIYDQMLNKQKTMDRAVDQIRTKHGNQALIRSCFLHAGVKPISGGVIEEEFPMMSSIL